MINLILKFLRLFAILLFLGRSVGISAQDLRIVSDSKGRIGFSDADGNIVIKCIYTAALPFEDGLARVCKKDQWGMIDSLGNPVLPVKYDEIYPFERGVAKVRIKDNYGLIDGKGQWVLPPDYTHISPFNAYDLAWVATGKLKSDGKKLKLFGGKVGIVSRKDGVKVGTGYDGLAEFSLRPNDWMGYTTGAKILSYGLLDTLRTDCTFLAYDKDSNGTLISPGLIDGTTGQVIVKAGTYHKICRPVGGMMRFYARPGKNGTVFGYYNLTSGKEIRCTVPDYSGGREITHSDFVGDIALVISGQEKTADGKWSATGYSVINKNGETVRDDIVQTQFGAGKTPGTGYWAFFKKTANGALTCDLCDENGHPLFINSDFSDIIFSNAEEEETLFCVQKDGYWGGIAQDGHIVIPFEWDQLLSPRHGVIYARKATSWGLLLTDGSEWIAPLYHEIAPDADRETDNVFVRTDSESWQNLKVGEAKPFPRRYQAIENFKDGFAWVQPVNFPPQDTFFNKIQRGLDNDSAMGYIVDTNDAIVSPLPVARKYAAAFRKALIEGNGVLSLQEARRLLLFLTIPYRTVKLSNAITEDEWDY